MTECVVLCLLVLLEEKNGRMMEHRWDTRVHTPVKLVVHTDDGRFLMSLTQNISRGGVVIDTEQLSAIESNKVVWMEFMEEDSIVKVPSYVLCCTDRTVALIFITHSQALHTYLDFLTWKTDDH